MECVLWLAFSYDSPSLPPIHRPRNSFRLFQLMEEYDSDEIGELDEQDPEVQGTQSLESLNEVLDEFLETQQEVVGRRMMSTLGDSLEGVDELRQALRDELTISDRDRYVVDHAETIGEPMPERAYMGGRHDEDRWDCRTILTTYTNTENHPHLVREERRRRARQQAEDDAKEDALVDATSRIKLSHKTGLPLGVLRPPTNASLEDESDDDDSPLPNLGAARNANETTEEKRARKAAVKEAKAARRVDKKATKVAFDVERQRQAKLTRKGGLSVMRVD